ncbi:hypothetical protein YA0002_22465 [Pseudomonas cichorii]|uniref:hypothetical protein n=1 Tax=Pseudomonas cichorii TaxID=36746 RepID=UPI0018E5ABFC|nr:hypothetical protein [Pseudomonas cichorii]MBI6855530.1 hypothetical protein [Pseudomonas cichorii]
MKLPLHPSLSPANAWKILGALGIVGMFGFLQFQIYKVNGGLSQTADKESINSFAQRISRVEERLDEKADLKLVSMDDFRASQQAMSKRLDDAQAQIKQIAQSIPVAVSMSDVVALEAKIESLQVALQEIRKVHVATPPSPAPVKIKTPAAPRKAEAIAKPIESTPPFTVIGVEYRGGERFLSVAPPGSTQLSQLNLVRPGDSIAGSNWRLNSLDESRALFSINGTQRTVSLKP